MQQILILTGISGSGKSTYARQFVLDNPGWLRINRDDLRKSIIPGTLNEYWQQDKNYINRIETLVNDLQRSAIVEALQRGWNLLIDNTHLKQKYINDLLKVFDDFEVEIHFKLIEIPIEEAIERDKNRQDVVSEKVIREQFGKLQILKKNFDFNKIIHNTPKSPPVLEQDATLPKCVLVDIDGTVATRANRSPFDWKRVGEDLPKMNVINLVKSLKNHDYKIIFFSGRDNICHPESSAWLSQYFGWDEGKDFLLFMRPENDNRKDSIIKKELFDLHIRDKYFVEMVVDDRDQVVAMWRKELGLTCLQVDYGNF
jgi:predicted kinase